jgi:hypothetical protein
MKKIFSFLFAIAFLLTFFSLFSQKSLAITGSSENGDCLYYNYDGYELSALTGYNGHSYTSSDGSVYTNLNSAFNLLWSMQPNGHPDVPAAEVNAFGDWLNHCNQSSSYNWQICGNTVTNYINSNISSLMNNYNNYCKDAGSTCFPGASSLGCKFTFDPAPIPAPPGAIDWTSISTPFCGNTYKAVSGINFFWHDPSTGGTPSYFKFSYGVSSPTQYSYTVNHPTTSFSIPQNSSTCTSGPGGCGFGYDLNIQWQVQACNNDGCGSIKPGDPFKTANCQQAPSGGGTSPTNTCEDGTHAGQTCNTTCTTGAGIGNCGDTSGHVICCAAPASSADNGPCVNNYVAGVCGGTDGLGTTGSLYECHYHLNSIGTKVGDGYADSVTPCAPYTCHVAGSNSFDYCDSASPPGGGGNPPAATCTVTWTGTPATVSQGSSFKVIVVPGTGTGWTNEKLYLDGTQVTSNATWAKYPDPQTGPDDSWTFSNPGTVGNHTLKFNNGTTDCTSTFNYTVTGGSQNTGTPISLIVGLDGVGITGDQVDKTPLDPTKAADAKLIVTPVTARKIENVTVEVDSGTIKKGSGTGTITYQDTGTDKYFFKGTVTLDSAITAGNYDVKVTVEEHLSNTIKNQPITTAGPNNVATINNAQAGDVAGSTGTGTTPDNQLNPTDYTALISCMPQFKFDNTISCSTTLQHNNDLNLDGKIDQADYNLWLREYSSARITGD